MAAVAIGYAQWLAAGGVMAVGVMAMVWAGPRAAPGTADAADQSSYLAMTPRSQEPTAMRAPSFENATAEP